MIENDKKKEKMKEEWNEVKIAKEHENRMDIQKLNEQKKELITNRASSPILPMFKLGDLRSFQTL